MTFNNFDLGTTLGMRLYNSVPPIVTHFCECHTNTIVSDSSVTTTIYKDIPSNPYANSYPGAFVLHCLYNGTDTTLYLPPPTISFELKYSGGVATSAPTYIFPIIESAYSFISSIRLFWITGMDISSQTHSSHFYPTVSFSPNSNVYSDLSLKFPDIRSTSFIRTSQMFLGTPVVSTSDHTYTYSIDIDNTFLNPSLSPYVFHHPVYAGVPLTGQFTYSSFKQATLKTPLFLC